MFQKKLYRNKTSNITNACLPENVVSVQSLVEPVPRFTFHGVSGKGQRVKFRRSNNFVGYLTPFEWLMLYKTAADYWVSLHKS